ncbi:MAG TPA: hypothetical protein VMM78_09945 [Thermomicrobiales bacterium]|nr:hypothetical protein [Thermomicrobiales bacterium]
MARQRHPQDSSILVVHGDKPLIGLLSSEQDTDTVTYFVDEDAADHAVTERVIRNALSLAGAWSDVPWDEIEAGLDRIRHESVPSPPLEL